jgi:SAM-dependent MidA family methyltransferase
MSDMRAIIGKEVAQRGFISFGRFMELALYCPNFGYYEHLNASPGRRGDFFTSVSVSGLFGELLASRFAEWLGELPGDGRQIMEAGAHDGQLAVDILDWLKTNRSDLFEGVQYWILEPSARRREMQQRRLASFGSKVRWFDSWNALPVGGVSGIIFSNELLDALPVRRAGWDAVQQKWFEWGVAASGDQFVWTKLPADNELEEEIRSWNLPPGLLQVLPDGFSTEIGDAARQWWRHAARTLKQGKLLAFDYGLEHEEFFAPERKDGTLRAYYRHHLETGLLGRPGEQDLTAQVNFTAVWHAGEAEGLKTETFTTQANFLTEIVRDLCERNPSSSEWMAKHSRAFQTLTHPEHLGRSFRVLLQTR